MSELCKCCGEAPVWAVAREHGYDYCEVCSAASSCNECDCMVTDADYIWEFGLCEECRGRKDREAVQDAAEEALYARGWKLAGASESSEATYFSRPGCTAQIRVAAHESTPWNQRGGVWDMEIQFCLRPDEAAAAAAGLAEELEREYAEPVEDQE